MNCNSKPTTNRPLVKSSATMNPYNPYLHGMFNSAPLDFGLDPVQMQLKIQQQQYLTRLYQQQQLQNLSGPNTLQFPLGNATHGLLMRQRQEQEMMFLHQQQMHLANLAQQAHASSQVQSMAGIHAIPMRNFGYQSNNNINSQMHDTKVPSQGNTSFGKGTTSIQVPYNQKYNIGSEGQNIAGSKIPVNAGSSNGKQDVQLERAENTKDSPDVQQDKSVKRKSNFKDPPKDKTQRNAVENYGGEEPT
jgi:hypothetical protein